MRCVSPRSARAGTAALLVTLVGCSSPSGPPQETRVVFDGQTYTIHAPVDCAINARGKLTISVRTDRGKKLISVVLTRDPPFVVNSVGFRHDDVRGYTNNSNELSAAKGDNMYTISGWMPPEEGETLGHQFKIDVICTQIEEYTTGYRTPSHIPRPPRSYY
jgi:Mycobacterium 19 kDa lipoprotein antigen